MSQQPKEEAAPAKGDASSSPPLDFSGIDFSKPEACLDLKEEHDQCFHVWLAKFVKGEAQTDECKPSWERYRACTAVRPLHLFFLYYFVIYLLLLFLLCRRS